MFFIDITFPEIDTSGRTDSAGSQSLRLDGFWESHQASHSVSQTRRNIRNILCIQYHRKSMNFHTFPNIQKSHQKNLFINDGPTGVSGL